MRQDRWFSRARRNSGAALVGIAFWAAATPADAAVMISSAATSNMNCSNGTCAPTASKAVLNSGDLENLLASGNMTVVTTGSGGVQANDIDVRAALGWSSQGTLSLDAYRSITIQQPVSIAGLSGLSIAINDGGSGGVFSFAAKGHVEFANLSSVLTINGAAYTLESSIKSLAGAIAANSSGDYALANTYDASGDGTYQNSPIPTEFGGAFEGLGNTISNLSLNGTGDVNAPVGLFAELANGNQLGGAAENIVLHNVSIGGNGINVGGLVGINAGTIAGAFVSGFAESEGETGFNPSIGLLAGLSVGTIVRSGAEGTVTSQQSAAAGGLVSGNSGSITQSYAHCKVSAGSMSVLGGLAAGSRDSISQSYAMGTVTDTSGSKIGGLVGVNSSTIAQSYSTTALKNIGRKSPDAGGLIGIDDAQAGDIASSYWDTSTSHIKSLKRGAGTPRNDPGIAGLTSTQLQSGLPAGFDPAVWAENPNINNGFPYLIANPPPQ